MASLRRIGEIEEQHELAATAVEEIGSEFYEGVHATLAWVLGLTDDTPVDEDELEDEEEDKEGEEVEDVEEEE